MLLGIGDPILEKGDSSDAREAVLQDELLEDIRCPLVIFARFLS